MVVAVLVGIPVIVVVIIVIPVVVVAVVVAGHGEVEEYQQSANPVPGLRITHCPIGTANNPLITTLAPMTVEKSRQRY